MNFMNAMFFFVNRGSRPNLRRGILLDVPTQEKLGALPRWESGEVLTKILIPKLWTHPSEPKPHPWKVSGSDLETSIPVDEPRRAIE